MKDISLKDLLEAGCHFGHRVDRWHPKAASFIYQARDGVHIIDLVKTKEGLRKAAEFIKNLASSGKTVLFVGTKRQARGVTSQAAKRANVPYLVSRWIGGFITNWDEVKKNIDKLNNLKKEQEEGAWQKYPKHEIIKLSKILRNLESVYGGVASLKQTPDAIYIVDIKKEASSLKEAARKDTTTIAIVDTNTDPTPVDYPIPANDDAVGSIQYITNYLADSYIEGQKMGEKKEEGKDTKMQRSKEEEKEAKEVKTQRDKEVKMQSFKDEKKEKGAKKRGRPRKSI